MYVIEKDLNYKKMEQMCYLGLKHADDIEDTPSVRNRLEKEMEIIHLRGVTKVFLDTAEVISDLELKPYQFSVNGTIGNSLVAYLCGISNINPVVNKLHFELCNCNRINLNVVSRKAELIESMINNPSIRVRTMWPMDFVDNLVKKTGIDVSEYDFNDKETIRCLKNGDVEGLPGVSQFTPKIVLEDVRPKNKEELVRAIGIAYGFGTWYMNANKIIESGISDIKGVVSTRDDLFNFLLDSGVSKLMAYSIAQSVSGNMGINEDQEITMKKANIPEWYINSCKMIHYLFPKAQALNYTKFYLWIAWYKQHFPLALKE